MRKVRWLFFGSFFRLNFYFRGCSSGREVRVFKLKFNKYVICLGTCFYLVLKTCSFESAFVLVFVLIFVVVV